MTKLIWDGDADLGRWSETRLQLHAGAVAHPTVREIRLIDHPSRPCTPVRPTAHLPPFPHRPAIS